MMRAVPRTDISVSVTRSDRDSVSEHSGDIKLPIIKISKSEPVSHVDLKPFAEKRNKEFHIEIPEDSDEDEVRHSAMQPCKSGKLFSW